MKILKESKMKMNCWYCKKEMQIHEKVKKIKAPWDLRKKINMHYNCWIEWGVNTIKPLVESITNSISINMLLYRCIRKNIIRFMK